jgi:nucleoside-diphosphate-sugar epimerase
MSRTIVITGATGFIGSMLARRLASTDWQVRALVRPASIHKQPNEIASEWITGDLEDMGSLRRLVGGAKAVVHCAGAVRGTHQVDFERTNVDGVARLVQAATEQHPKPRFLLISSLAAREPDLSYYAASKRKGEKALASKSSGMPWVIFRPPVVYGPGDREMLPLFQWMQRGITPIIGSGKSRISLLYVTDLAEAIVYWLHRGKRSGCVYELHDGHTGGYMWQDIIDAVSRLNGRPIYRAKIPVSFLKLIASLNLTAARVFGRAPMLTPGKVRELTHPNWICDNTALNSDTGWTPKITLEEGLRRTLRQCDLVVRTAKFKKIKES